MLKISKIFIISALALGLLLGGLGFINPSIASAATEEELLLPDADFYWPRIHKPNQPQPPSPLDEPQIHKPPGHKPDNPQPPSPLDKPQIHKPPVHKPDLHRPPVHKPHRPVPCRYHRHCDCNSCYVEHTSVGAIKEALNDYFENAGANYFGDKGIDVIIDLSGDRNDLTYTIQFDFDDAAFYNDLTELSRANIISFLNDFKNRIVSEIDNTNYDNADIYGKLGDIDNLNYFVIYNGYSYIFSWSI